MLPVPSDLPALLARLRAEERDQRKTLANLEAALRAFEDVERPAHERWLRLELGPLFVALERRHEELRARHATAYRVQTLVERDGWEPREALHLALHPEDEPARRDRVDPDVVAARRRAKVERKRAERKAARRAEAAAAPPPAGAPDVGGRRVALYRAIARRLHPDSPTALRDVDPVRATTLWTEANTAYAASDLDRLLAIATWLDAANDDAAPPVATTTLGERYERLRGLARAVRALERRLAHLAGDPAWGFTQRSARDRARLRADAARRLDDERRRLEVAVAEIDAMLAEIGTPRAPRRDRRR